MKRNEPLPKTFIASTDKNPNIEGQLKCSVNLCSIFFRYAKTEDCGG
jgi:hypothetical protein